MTYKSQAQDHSTAEYWVAFHCHQDPPLPLGARAPLPLQGPPIATGTNGSSFVSSLCAKSEEASRIPRASTLHCRASASEHGAEFIPAAKCMEDPTSQRAVEGHPASQRAVEGNAKRERLSVVKREGFSIAMEDPTSQRAVEGHPASQRAAEGNVKRESPSTARRESSSTTKCHKH